VFIEMDLPMPSQCAGKSDNGAGCLGTSIDLDLGQTARDLGLTIVDANTGQTLQFNIGISVSGDIGMGVEYGTPGTPFLEAGSQVDFGLKAGTGAINAKVKLPILSATIQVADPGIAFSATVTRTATAGSTCPAS
jgi:hypothetical protein